MSLKDLKNDLKYKKFKNLYLFFGPEDYLKSYYLNLIIKEYMNKELEVFNKVYLEGKVEEKDLIDICETYPVMCEKKIVIVKNSSFFKLKGKEKKSGKDSFKKYLSELPEYVILIFYEDLIDKRTSIVNAIKKIGRIVEFDYQSPNDLTNWIIKAFLASNKKIDIHTTKVLIEYCEPGMNEILNEVNKLVLYKKDSENILAEDIKIVCTKSIKSRIFDLVDSAAGKKSDEAIKLLEDMINLGEHVQKIFILLSRHFVSMIKMKTLSMEGMNIDEISKKLKLNPYVAKKIYRQITKFDLLKLNYIIENFAEMDLKIKSGKIKDKIALEILIISIAN
jgi:DNA polymerase-3 subunit delta